jgi:probable HAF family extracellular repeat protein
MKLIKCVSIYCKDKVNSIRKLSFISFTLFFISPLLLTNPVHSAFFMGLGDLEGGSIGSKARDVSADGTTVVGYSSSVNGTEAFKWTKATGMMGLGDLDGGSFQSFASGVSADGSIVVGHGYTEIGQRAFVWTMQEGMVDLGYFEGGSPTSWAYGISEDGTIVVGSSYSEFGHEAFRWSESEGMVGLGDLEGGYFLSYALDTSADGSVVVGSGYSYSGEEAFIWTEELGMVGIGDLEGGKFSSYAFAVSSDGSTVVGRGQSDSGTEAFIWNETMGMVGLGDLEGGLFFSQADGVSADGTKVVGYSSSAFGPEAFMWDAQNGMRSIKDILMNEYGLDITEWSLYQANGISSDGNIIVGRGTNPEGYMEAWIADLRLPVTVGLDIKPGSGENCLNINSHGVIPVAILGGADFDVSNINIDTLLFNGSRVQVRGKGKTMCHYEDVSGDFTFPEGAPDGYFDLVCQFEDDPSQWVTGQAEATVTGKLIDGTPIEGNDFI